jgi:hypothetical protein
MEGAMSVIAAHGIPEEFGWTIPLVVLMLLIGGAIGSLVVGVPSPDLIAADGIASPFVGIP